MSSLRPPRDRAVRVLAAEAADPPGRLAGLLERAGHRVVARAATAEELTHLVRVARPEVVVFDPEMSAVTVAALRRSRPTIGVVVVWPEGAAAEVADEHVSPARVGVDLAGAVRRAAPVGAAAVGLASAGPASSPAATAAPSAVRPQRIGRGGLELSVAAVLTLLLLVVAIAFRAQEDGATLTAASARIVSPSSPAPATNVRIAPPEAPSVVPTDPVTVVGEAPSSPSGPSRISAPGARITGGSGVTGPATDRAPGPPPVRDATLTARQAGKGPMILARAKACQEATAKLGIAGAGPLLRRLLDRCVATDSAGLLRALARVAAHAGHGPPGLHKGHGHGRPGPNKDGPGKARGHGSAAHHRPGAAGHHGVSPGHGVSSKEHDSDHRPDGHGSGHGAAHHGEAPGHAKARSRNPRH